MSEPNAPSTPQDPVVRLDQVDFSYESGVPVIKQATFEIERGESLCLIGPNGGGKTTIFRLVLGQLKPDRGVIEVLGQPPRKACRRIGYTPQHVHFDPKFPVTVLDIVLMGRVSHSFGGPYRRDDHEAAQHALERMDLVDLARRHFGGLSGGQRQRALIARALTCEPEVLLLDEPTANVDLAVEARFLDTIESLKSELTIITVTHDLGVVNHLAGRVLCVNRTVHSHRTADLTGEVIREIFTGEHRLAHERATLHSQGDHTHCGHH